MFWKNYEQKYIFITGGVVSGLGKGITAASLGRLLKNRGLLEENGLVTSGINKELDLVEIVEIPKNKYFVACQFHPEFKSRPNNPAPLFYGLIKSAINKK